MRLFQNSGIYPAYIPRLRRLTRNCASFASQVAAFLDDRYGAAHLLQPVLGQEPAAFFTNGDDEILQRLWAAENGLPANASLEAILLAQIEHHRTEIFYNMDPMRYGSDFVRRLPGCVRASIAWRAAPSGKADFAAYGLMVCNFPSILRSYRNNGWNAEYFCPAHDPEMDSYAANGDRPVDVLFVGGYSRHHRNRAQVLEAVAGLRSSAEVAFHLDRSRLTRLAESPLGYLMPLAGHRRPADIRTVSQAPVFGRELYTALSRAKIVLNGAVDMAGNDRGNMRCFEAMGCGALMVTDQGEYPLGMVDGVTMLVYADARDARQKISKALADPEGSRSQALQGFNLMSGHYSKARQWADFIALAARLH